jgi:hypothetical protein
MVAARPLLASRGRADVGEERIWRGTEGWWPFGSGWAELGRCIQRQRHAVAAAARGGPVGSAVSGGGWWWSRLSNPGVWSWSVGGAWIPSSLAQALPSSPPCDGTASSRWLSGRSGSLGGGAAPGSRRWGSACWGRFSGRGARPFGATALSTPWWGGRHVRTSDGHPLPGVELRVVLPRHLGHS